MRVNSSCLRRLPFLFVIACLLVLETGARAQEKKIHLRNETISTPSRTAVAAALQPQLASPVSSGLFVVQFVDRLQPAWREQLRQMRVELLRYVPDDAFVARFNGVDPEQVRRLAFVQWVGPYRPEHKIDTRLKGAGNMKVRVLLSPGASARDRLIVRRSVRTFARESRLRFGNVLQAEVTPKQLETLSQSDAVLWIEPAPKPKLLDEISSKIVGGDDGE